MPSYPTVLAVNHLTTAVTLPHGQDRAPPTSQAGRQRRCSTNLHADPSLLLPRSLPLVVRTKEASLLSLPTINNHDANQQNVCSPSDHYSAQITVEATVWGTGLMEPVASDDEHRSVQAKQPGSSTRHGRTEKRSRPTMAPHHLPPPIASCVILRPWLAHSYKHGVTATMCAEHTQACMQGQLSPMRHASTPRKQGVV